MSSPTQALPFPDSAGALPWRAASGEQRAVTAAKAAPHRRPLEVDPRLVERCRQGDRQAFDAFFEATKDHVYSLALHFAGDEAVAADITHDVFLKLLGRIRQFRRDAQLTTWLYRVILNTFLDHHRARRPALPLEDAAEAPQLTLAAGQEETVARGDAERAVRRAVATLPPRFRAPLVLRYGAELSYGEIAAVLGISAGTVASRLNRAYQQLARKLRHLRR